MGGRVVTSHQHTNVSSARTQLAGYRCLGSGAGWRRVYRALRCRLASYRWGGHCLRIWHSATQARRFLPKSPQSSLLAVMCRRETTAGRNAALTSVEQPILIAGQRIWPSSRGKRACGAFAHGSLVDGKIGSGSLLRHILKWLSFRLHHSWHVRVQSSTKLSISLRLDFQVEPLSE